MPVGQRWFALALLAPLAGCLPATRGTVSQSCGPVEEECRLNIANYSNQDVVVRFGRGGWVQVASGSAKAVTISDPSVGGTVRLSATSEATGRIVCSRDVKLSEGRVADFVIVDRCNPQRDIYPLPGRDGPAERPTEPTTESQIPSSGEPATPPPGS